MLTTALHNVGAWLLDPRTQRKLNGVNSRLLSKITGRKIWDEAKEPTICAVQWARAKRVRWLGHILREEELSLVKTAVLASYNRGVQGTLIDEAPPHRSIQHLCALASKGDNFWENWCKQLERTVQPKKYGGLANPNVRRALRSGQRGPYDPVAPTFATPPPTCLTDGMAFAPREPAPTVHQRVRDLVEEALAEVRGQAHYDPGAPVDIYTDGSCLDNGLPWAAAGWGVHVVNSDKLGDYYGALSGSAQSNNRAELAAVEVALQLAWASDHMWVRIFTDSKLACMGIRNEEGRWAWRKALGVNGWLDRWERQQWRTTSGKRVSHADIWRKILFWLRRFDNEPRRILYVTHVKAHTGVVGNEKADKLASKGSKLRHDLLIKAATPGWFKYALEHYWENRI